jgi:hypothetical protein
MTISAASFPGRFALAVVFFDAGFSEVLIINISTGLSIYRYITDLVQ